MYASNGVDGGGTQHRNTNRQQQQQQQQQQQRWEREREYSSQNDGNSYGLAITQPQRRVHSAAPSHHQQQHYQQQKQQTQHHQQQQQQLQQQPQPSYSRRPIDHVQEDALEYFIKFPTASNVSTITRTEADTTALIAGADQDYTPIVLLLGWAGCQDRYLMKYSRIYEERGLITVRYTAPVDTLFWRRAAMIPIGEKILKLIYDMNFDAHPVIVHIFSNGGAYLYQHISLAMKHHQQPLHVRGMIFDSAPGERRMLGLYRAITAIYGREQRKCNCLTALIITFTLSVMWFVEEAYSAFKSLFVKQRIPVQTNPFSDLKNEPNQFPQLFLYSKGDVVIPYQDVEKFIRIRRQQDVEVTAVCFEDAEHVKIFTKYPGQYVHCISTFVSNCLSVPYRAAVAALAETASKSSLTSSTYNGGTNSSGASNKYE